MGYTPPRRAVVLVAAIAAASIATIALAAAVPTEVYSPQTIRILTPQGPKTVPILCASGRVLIRLRPGATAEQLREALQGMEGRILKAWPDLGLYMVSLPHGMSVREGVLRWAGQAPVAAAYPDLVKYAARVPNDPLYSQQWQWDKISAPSAWDIQTGSASVVVAILDTGIDLDHPDLQSRIWTNANEIPGNGVDDDANGYTDDYYGWDFIDDDGVPDPGATDATDPNQAGAFHGTHVAGLVGAATDNAIGVAGHDWACRLMAVRVMDVSGVGFDSDIIDGVNYAIDNGANVINLSLVGGYSSAYDVVFQKARQLGVVVVAAAGNNDHEFLDNPATWMSPVCNDGPQPQQDNWVLGVAATDQNDQKTWFSNYDGSSYGTFVDVSAPGENIWSTLIDDPAHGFDTPYGPADGTSMAAPIVAGLVALVLAQYPGYTPEAVIEQIKTTCDDIDSVNPGYAGKLGAGRINSAAALSVHLPPRPPQSVVAGDTPNDEGGSITVSWTRSPDDGAGRNSVVEYRIYRSDDDTSGGGHQPLGNWTQVGSVPAGGATVFNDTSIAGDGIYYWYVVAAFDGAAEGWSNPAGPAAARDDLPPPPITTLYAGDTQADDGGSITLSWPGYTPPADFAGYRVYRSTSEFTRISEAELIADLPKVAGNPPSPYYQDTDVVDGTEYWYAVTAYDDVGNEQRTVTAVGPVVPYPNFMLSLPPGLQMIALPARTRDRDMAAVLGIDPNQLQLARWDPVQEAYHSYSPAVSDSFLEEDIGRGYWVQLTSSLLLAIGGMPAEGDEFRIDLAAGWNQIGNPFDADVDWSAVQIEYGGTRYTLDQAYSMNIAGNFAWIWNPYTQGYRLVTAYAGLGQQKLPRCAGFFFLAWQPCTLIVPRPAGATAVARSRQASPADWLIRLELRSEGRVDADNFIGVGPREMVVQAPPAVDGGPRLHLLAADGTKAAAVVSSQANARWELVVEAPQGGRARLCWPDLSRLPRDLRPVLIDEATGRRVYMRTATGYDMELSPGEVRKLAMELAEVGPLAVRAAAVSAGPRPVVALSLTADAAVDAVVMNLAGRPVRVLAKARPMAAGEHQLVWDGLGSSGQPVPPGVYLIRIRAVTGTGQQASAVARVLLRR